MFKTNQKQGFPRCIRSVDCMHLHWKNRRRANKGQYHNPKDCKLAMLSCETVADSDLYCWHWFDGRCGSNNDIALVDNSPLFIDMLTGRRRILLRKGYVFYGTVRYWPLCLLSDGIYPNWTFFVKPIPAP